MQRFLLKRQSTFGFLFNFVIGLPVPCIKSFKVKNLHFCPYTSTIYSSPRAFSLGIQRFEDSKDCIGYIHDYCQLISGARVKFHLKNLTVVFNTLPHTTGDKCWTRKTDRDRAQSLLTLVIILGENLLVLYILVSHPSGRFSVTIARVLLY